MRHDRHDRRGVRRASGAFWGVYVGLSMVAAITGCGESNEPTAVTTVQLLTPGDGELLTGFVDVRVSAENATAVEYFVDDLLIARQRTPPFALRWDSSAMTNGPHILRAAASGAVNTAFDAVEISGHNASRGTEIFLDPVSIHLGVGDSLRFHAHVYGPSNRSVRWALRNGPGHGTITTNGIFIAPEEVPRPPKSIIEATSVGDPNAVVVGEAIIGPDQTP